MQSYRTRSFALRGPRLLCLPQMTKLQTPLLAPAPRKTDVRNRSPQAPQYPPPVKEESRRRPLADAAAGWSMIRSAPVSASDRCEALPQVLLFPVRPLFPARPRTALPPAEHSSAAAEAAMVRQLERLPLRKLPGRPEESREVLPASVALQVRPRPASAAPAAAGRIEGQFLPVPPGQCRKYPTGPPVSAEAEPRSMPQASSMAEQQVAPEVPVLRTRCAEEVLRPALF